MVSAECFTEVASAIVVLSESSKTRGSERAHLIVDKRRVCDSGGSTMAKSRIWRYGTAGSERSECAIFEAHRGATLHRTLAHTTAKRLARNLARLDVHYLRKPRGLQLIINARITITIMTPAMRQGIFIHYSRVTQTNYRIHQADVSCHFIL